MEKEIDTIEFELEDNELGSIEYYESK